MKTISLVIPTYNESSRIKKTLNILKQRIYFYGQILKEIIFVDDGSTDTTLTLIKRDKKNIETKLKVKVKIISFAKNKGRGYAIRQASLLSESDYILYTDADFSIPLENLKKFIPYIKKGYDIIIGSKKIKGAQEVIKRSFIRRIVGYGHSIIAYLILGVFVWDFQGGFKLFSRNFVNKIFPYLQIDRWGFDMEVIFLAKKLNYQLKEVPVKWYHVENNSKVILLRDILRSLKEMIKIKFHWIQGKYQENITPKFAFRLS